MKICESLGCTKPATTERVICAPFSMTSTATLSRSKKELCDNCAAADERAKQFGKRPTFGSI